MNPVVLPSASTRARLLRGRLARSPAMLVAGPALLVLVLAALAGPLLAPGGGPPDQGPLLAPPSGEHWFGTTKLGEDLFHQTMLGLRRSLVIGLLVAVLSTGLAAAVGTAAGYLAGPADRALTWLTDLLLVLPPFVVLAVLSPLLRGRSWLLLVLLLAAFQWMLTARLVRSRTRVLRTEDYVVAARLTGASAPRVIGTHVLPAMAPLLLVDVTLNVAGAVLGEAGLSFFGFGVRPPDVSLGTLLAAGSESALTFPWLFLCPAGVLVGLVLAVGYLGEGLRSAVQAGGGSGR